MRAKIALLLAGALLMGLPASAPAAPTDRDAAPVAQRGDEAEALGGEGPYWSEIRRRCFKPKHANHAVRTHCFQLLKLRKDGNGRRDFFTLHHYGTARSKSGYGLKIFRLRVYKHEDGPRIMAWSDWNPKSDDQTDRCGTINVGVSYVASVSWSHRFCEEWDIRFYQDRPGKFKNAWKASGFHVENSEREVAYAIAVAVKQGKSPRWHFRAYADTY